MVDRRVSLITLGVADLARSRASCAALGWREAGESMEGVAPFRLPGEAPALRPLVDLAADRKRALAPGSGAATLGRNVAAREAVDAPAAGATALRPPEATPWGGHVAHVADPDGHVRAFARAPQFPLGPDGSLTLPSAGG